MAAITAITAAGPNHLVTALFALLSCDLVIRHSSRNATRSGFSFVFPAASSSLSISSRRGSDLTLVASASVFLMRSDNCDSFKSAGWPSLVLAACVERATMDA